MTLRYLVPALAVVSTVSAACNGPFTISSSADAAALSTCRTFTGDIAVATSNGDDIALDGIQRITGSLTVKNNNKMSTLSADSLATIDDTFTLGNIQLLSTLNFPSLQSVDTVDWEGLPNLGSLSFTAGLSDVSSLSIQNTVLGTLEGINLMMVDTMFIVNNFYLNDISMQISNVTQSMTLSANGDDVLAEFPNLKSGQNIYLANCSTINLQSLSAITGSLNLRSNYITGLSLTNLTTVGKSFAVIDNAMLTNITAPSLKSVGGGFIISNNTDLTSVTFAKLQTVGGAIDMNGAFKSVSLPSIENVKGTFNLQSTSNQISSSCKKFTPLHQGNAPVLHGNTFVCKSTANPKGVGSIKGGGSSTSGGSSSSSSGAANPVYISGATGILGVVAAIFGML